MNTNNSTDYQEDYQEATFAGGCFWCMVAPFQQLNGVVKVESGYTGGHKENPSYQEVCTNETGHVEAIRITFDPSVINYTQLLEIYWKQIDPTDPGGQFADRGESYQTAIFYHNEVQKKEAEASKAKLESSKIFDKPIVTPILPGKTFYHAEEYHQNYHEKKPVHYGLYRKGSGREGFLKKHWQQDNTK